MHKSTLLFHFKILRESQFEDFRVFLSSDYFNSGPLKEDVIALFDLIISVYPDLNHDLLYRENAHAAIFPGKEFLKGRLDKVMHEMNKILKEYILWTRFKSDNNEFYRDLEWLQVIRETEDLLKYQLAFEKVKAKSEEQHLLSIEKYKIDYLIENELHEWVSRIYSGKGDVNLINTLDRFGEYQLLQEIFYINNLLFTTKVSKVELPDNINKRISELSALTEKYNNPLLRSFLKTTQLLVLDAPSEDDFIEFMTFLKENENDLSHATLKDLYTCLRNLCVLVDNNNRHRNLKLVQHRINKECIRRGLFYYNDKIVPNALLTIAKGGFIAKDIEWAIDFIHAHKGRIIGELENEEYYYTILSMGLFNQKKYKECLDTLPKNITKNVNFLLTIKVLEIKCYYELKSELLIFKLDAFKVFLSRNTNKILSEEQQQGYTLFVSLLNQLIKCRKGETQKLNKVKLKLNSPVLVHETVWLTDKVEELR